MLQVSAASNITALPHGVIMLCNRYFHDTAAVYRETTSCLQTILTKLAGCIIQSGQQLQCFQSGGIFHQYQFSTKLSSMVSEVGVDPFSLLFLILSLLNPWSRKHQKYMSRALKQFKCYTENCLQSTHLNLQMLRDS